jgi:hypothetical protein
MVWFGLVWFGCGRKRRVRAQVRNRVVEERKERLEGGNGYQGYYGESEPEPESELEKRWRVC